MRAFYAIRMEDGRVISRWQAEAPVRFSGRDERFMHIGNRVYFLTDDQFTELNEEDILAGKHGWKTPDTGK